MPKEEDLHGAALALIRLQDTYNLNVTEMACGQISGSLSYIRMTGTSLLCVLCNLCSCRATHPDEWTNARIPLERPDAVGN